MDEQVRVLSKLLFKEGEAFNAADLQERTQAAVRALQTLLAPEQQVQASTVSYNYETTAEGVSLVGRISLAPQMPLRFDTPTGLDSTASRMTDLIADRNSIVEAGKCAQSRIDKVCSSVLQALTPLSRTSQLDRDIRSLGPWVMRNQGQQFPLQLDGKPVEYEVPHMSDVVLDQAMRALSGYVGAIAVDHFVIHDLEDSHAPGQGEKSMRGRRAKVLYTQQQVDRGCLFCLAASRTMRRRIVLSAKAYKMHFAERASHYALASWGNEDHWAGIAASIRSDLGQCQTQ